MTSAFMGQLFAQIAHPSQSELAMYIFASQKWPTKRYPTATGETARSNGRDISPCSALPPEKRASAYFPVFFLQCSTSTDTAWSVNPGWSEIQFDGRLRDTRPRTRYPFRLMTIAGRMRARPERPGSAIRPSVVPA